MTNEALIVRVVPLEMVSVVLAAMAIPPVLKLTVPEVLGVNVWLPVKDSVVAPPVEMVMLLAAVVESEIVPLPATVSALVLAMAIVPPDLDDVRVPAFVNVLPLTFIVMLLSLETVTY